MGGDTVQLPRIDPGRGLLLSAKMNSEFACIQSGAYIKYKLYTLYSETAICTYIYHDLINGIGNVKNIQLYSHLIYIKESKK